MNVLLVGSGSREHTIAWKLRQSARLGDLFIAPGNAGTAQLGTNIDAKASDVDGLLTAAKDLRADLVVIGPEESLFRGLADRLAVEGIATFGPSQAASRIEYSKAFSKELMLRHGIPTAAARIFDNRIEARNYLASIGGGVVVKADGPALGKGAFVCDSTEEAGEVVDRLMGDEAILGGAGKTVLIEERLTGREVSAMAFTDGQTVAPMPFSCDYKRAHSGDEGPNTGGMGAYSPADWLDESVASTIRSDITEVAVRAMAAEGRPYRGALYPGVMMTANGPMVIEFNCRMGDPETQVLLPRLQSDLLEVMWAVANNRLHEIELSWSSEACVAVVLASGGYPGAYETGLVIEGLDELDSDAFVFHAGTRRRDDGALVTGGGRVLTIAALGPTLEMAREKAYRNAERVRFAGAHYRRDIGAARAPAVERT